MGTIVMLLKAVPAKALVMLVGPRVAGWLPGLTQAVGDASDAKGLLTSRTFWGAMILAVAPYAPQLAVTGGDAQAWASVIGGVVGMALTIYGRIRATKKIGS